MTEKDKLANAMSPELAEKTWSARESWRVFGIMAEFVEATERLSAIRPAVSIFGSARTPPDHPYYVLAEEIARQLSDAGFSVISGGGPGLMEAANKGAYYGRSPERRAEHPAAARAGRKPLPGHQPDLPPLLRAQGDVREVRDRLRRHAGRLRHARRADGGADAGADRQDAPHADHPGARAVLARAARLVPRHAGSGRHDRFRGHEPDPDSSTSRRRSSTRSSTYYEKRGFEPSAVEREILLNL